MLNEFQEYLVGLTVKLVPNDGIPQPKRMGTNLMLAAGDGTNLTEREAARRLQRFENRLGALGGVRASHSDLGRHGGFQIFGQALLDVRLLSQLAMQDGQVGLGDLALLDGALITPGRGTMFGQQDEPAGLAIQTANQMQRLQAGQLATGPDEAGPWPGLGWMADDPAGLVDDQKVVVIDEYPRT